MVYGLSEQLLSQLSEFVVSRLGLHFPRERWRELERGVQLAAREFGFEDVEPCARWLLSAPLTNAQIEVLASELTIGETYFFREKRGMEILAERVLPELIRARQSTEQRLRIWSAGCCTGEEPYSLAIMLDRILPNPREWRVTILGTDINPRFLKKAVEGAYGEWSFRDAPPWLKEGYFKETGERRHELLPRIKERVTFGCLNLAEDAFPSLANNTNAMDVILCRNVLMYFSADRARRVIENFHRSLVDGGWLIVSPSETSHQLFSPFASVAFDGAIFYRKENRPAAAFLSQPAPLASTDDNFTEVSAPALVELDLKPALPAPVSSLESIGESVAHSQSAESKPSGYVEALALFEQGEYVQAIQKLTADSSPPESSAERAALLARISANLGDLAEARQWAEKAIAEEKLNAGLHYLRAVILQEQGAMDEAGGSLRRALYLDPNFVLAHFALGNMALHDKRLKEAAKHFSNTLALLQHFQDGEILPQSDGLAAGRLRELVQSTLSIERAA